MATKIEIAESLVNETALVIHQDRRDTGLFSSSFIFGEGRTLLVNER